MWVDQIIDTRYIGATNKTVDAIEDHIVMCIVQEHIQTKEQWSIIWSQAVFFAGIPLDPWEKSWCRYSVPRGSVGEGYIISYRPFIHLKIMFFITYPSPKSDFLQMICLTNHSKQKSQADRKGSEGSSGKVIEREMRI